MVLDSLLQSANGALLKFVDQSLFAALKGKNLALLRELTFVVRVSDLIAVVDPVWRLGGSLWQVGPDIVQFGPMVS